MILGMPYLLAETEIPLKLIIGVVFFLIWVISQVITAATKNKNEPVIPPPPSVPPQQPTSPPARVNRPVPPVQQKQNQRAKQQQRQQPAARRQQPPPLKKPHRREVAEPLVTLTEVVETVAARSPIVQAQPKRKSEGPNNQERLIAILRPANLRKDFILTEILRPPLSLRDD